MSAVESIKNTMVKAKVEVEEKINILGEFPAIDLDFEKYMDIIPDSYRCKEFKKLMQFEKKGIVNAIWMDPSFFHISIKGINNKKKVMDFIDKLNKNKILTSDNTKYKINSKIYPHYYEK